MHDFTLDTRLLRDSHLIADLSLCQVRLIDDARFPWLILVPRRADIREVFELSDGDQAQLWKEATALGQAMLQAMQGDKLNLATLGNMVPQLHLHVVVRRTDDAAWPAPVWGYGKAQPYADSELMARRERLRTLVEPLNLFES